MVPKKTETRLLFHKGRRRVSGPPWIDSAGLMPQSFQLSGQGDAMKRRSGEARRYFTMSFRLFKGRTLILVLAGLAAMSRTSPGLKGLGTFFRAGLAGTFTF